MVRLATGGARFEGRLAALSPDSLRLRGVVVDSTFARSLIDTLWVRGKQAYAGTTAGAGAALFFGLLLFVAGHRGSQPEDNGYGVLLGLTVGVGALGLGILADIATPAPWTLLFIR